MTWQIPRFSNHKYHATNLHFVERGLDYKGGQHHVDLSQNSLKGNLTMKNKSFYENILSFLFVNLDKSVECFWECFEFCSGHGLSHICVPHNWIFMGVKRNLTFQSLHYLLPFALSQLIYSYSIKLLSRKREARLFHCLCWETQTSE